MKTESLPGWMNVPLTEPLLDLILMVQAFRTYRQRYHMWCDTVGLPHEGNWRDETRSFYSEIDDKVLKSLHLYKNEDCFERVLTFQVTDEMRTTKYDDLPKRFVFRTWLPK